MKMLRLSMKISLCYEQQQQKKKNERKKNAMLTSVPVASFKMETTSM